MDDVFAFRRIDWCRPTVHVYRIAVTVIFNVDKSLLTTSLIFRDSLVVVDDYGCGLYSGRPKIIDYCVDSLFMMNCMLIVQCSFVAV